MQPTQLHIKPRRPARFLAPSFVTVITAIILLWVIHLESSVAKSLDTRQEAHTTTDTTSDIRQISKRHTTEKGKFSSLNSC